MRALLVLLLLGSALAGAGCSGPGKADGGDLPPGEPGLDGIGSVGRLSEGAFAFIHPGGPLEARLGGLVSGSAQLELLDGDEAAATLVDLDATNRTRTLDWDAGLTYVHVRSVEGTVSLLPLEHPGPRGENPLRFTPMVRHVEHHLLAEGEGLVLDPFVGTGTPVSKRLDLQLERVSLGLRVLSTGGYSGLDIRAAGPGGQLLVASGDSGTLPTPVLVGYSEVPGTFMREAIGGRALQVEARADSLTGVLVLESVSYSLAAIPAPAGSQSEPVVALGQAAAHVYGSLTQSPVGFKVAAQATTVLLYKDRLDEGTSWVALFGPGDRHVATVPVVPGQARSIPVVPGPHVAVVVDGTAVQMGADAIPTDFVLHPRETVTTVWPGPRPEGQSSFIHVAETVHDAGVPYWVQESFGAAPTGFCTDPGLLRVLQDGKVLGTDQTLLGTNATAIRLRDAPLVVQFDGVDELLCETPRVQVLGFRPDSGR